MTSLVIRDADVRGRRTDVLIGQGRIVTVEAGLRVPPGSTVFEAGGGALLPGLHDHHVHLLALAARASSVRLGPPAVRSPDQLDRVLQEAHRAAPRGSWLRCVEHDDRTGGDLDRDRLDRLAPGRPVRVQHRSGAVWVLSSTALDLLPLEDRIGGVERNADGRATGRLWRLDDWLRRHLPPEAAPDLGTVGRMFAGRGVTGVTDATPSTDPSGFELLAAAVRDGHLPLHVSVMGGMALADVAVPEPLRRGPVKLVIGDHDIPALADLSRQIEHAHSSGRAVAIHCVTAVATSLALAAWDDAGTSAGDRLEHGSVLHPAAARRLRELGVTVVTQPAFVHDHGDRYLREVEHEDQPHLYRCGSLLEHGVAVGGSSDAPFGSADPWRAIATAVDRRTAGGRPIGPAEAISPRRALDLYLTTAEDPGGRARTVRAGAPADLCVLTEPLASALAAPSSIEVQLTVVGGKPSHVLGDGLDQALSRT